MAQVQIVVEPHGISKVKAAGADGEERMASLKLIELLLPAIERFEVILAEFIDTEAATEADE